MRNKNGVMRPHLSGNKTRDQGSPLRGGDILIMS